MSMIDTDERLNEINHYFHSHTPVKVFGCCSLTTYQWRHWMAASLFTRSFASFPVFKLPQMTRSHTRPYMY